MQSEVEQLSVEKYQMNQMIERNNDEKAKILREKTELLLIAIKHTKLMREARERLECPVCLVIVLFLLTFSFSLLSGCAKKWSSAILPKRPPHLQPLPAEDEKRGKGGQLPNLPLTHGRGAEPPGQGLDREYGPRLQLEGLQGKSSL